MASAAHRILTTPARHAAATAAAAAEQHDAIAADLGGIALVAVLVVPLPRLQPALDVDLLSFGEIFSQRLRRLAPQHDAVPLGFLLPLAAFVVPHLGGRHVEGGDSSAAWCVAQFSIASEVADQN